MIANHLIKIVNHVLTLYSGNLENFGNVQNEQFSRRHFYVPFGEFVHLYISKIFKNIQKYAQILKGGTLWLQ